MFKFANQQQLIEKSIPLEGFNLCPIGIIDFLKVAQRKKIAKLIKENTCYNDNKPIYFSYRAHNVKIESLNRNNIFNENNSKLCFQVNLPENMKIRLISYNPSINIDTVGYLKNFDKSRTLYDKFVNVFINLKLFSLLYYIDDKLELIFSSRYVYEDGYDLLEYLYMVPDTDVLDETYFYDSSKHLFYTIDSGECTVCLENKISILFTSCGHYCCCTECAKYIKEKNTTKHTCPLCRTRSDFIYDFSNIEELFYIFMYSDNFNG